MKRYIVLNASLTDNIGDQLIGEAIKITLREKKCEFDIHELSASYYFPNCERLNNTIIQFKTARYLVYIIYNIKVLINIITKNNNGLIIGGGQLLKKQFLSRIKIWVKIYNIFNRGEVYLVGVGGEGNYSNREILLLKSIAKNSKSIYVRDQITMDILKKCCKNNANIHLMPDVVFWLSCERNQYCNIVSGPKIKQSTVLIPSSYESMKKYNNYNSLSEKDYYKIILDHIKNEINNNREVIITNTTREDYNYSIEVFNSLPEKYKKSCNVVLSKSIIDLLLIYKKINKVISNRMHALIFAMINDKEVEVVLRNIKLEQFNNEYLKRYNSKIIDRDKYLSELHNKVDEVWNTIIDTKT